MFLRGIGILPMMSSNHGKMPVPLLCKTAVTVVKSFAETALMAADALQELEDGKTIPLDEVLHDPRLS